MVKRKKKTSLGLVLTERCIEAVYAEKALSREVRLRGGRIDLPAGLLQNGRFTAPARAAALIQKLLRQEKIPARKATVLVPDTQTVARILDLPAELPNNMHKYIHAEVRYSPILTKQTPYSDYRTLGADNEGREKILVGVTTRQCIENLVYTLSLAGLEILSFEMDFCALHRVFYSQIFTGQKPDYLLLAGITGQTLTVCVWIRNKLDYIQRFSISDRSVAQKAAALKQLRTIRQFYEIEKGYSFHQSWKAVTVVDAVPPDIESWRSDLHALFGDGAEFFTPLDLPVACKSGGPVSFAGYGAALKTLEPACGLPSPELLPRFFRDHYAWKRTTRMTAAVAAGVVLALYAGTALFQTLCRAESRPAEMPAAKVIGLADQQQRLQQELDALRNLQEVLDTLAQREAAISYPQLLKEIGLRIPSGLQITAMEISASGIVSLRGRALSFQAIHQFAATLEQSRLIAEAVVEQSRVNSGSSRIFDFQIRCQVRRKTPEGEVAND